MKVTQLRLLFQLVIGLAFAAANMYAGPLVDAVKAFSDEFQILGVLATIAGIIWAGWGTLWGHSDHPGTQWGRVLMGGTMACGAGAFTTWIGWGA